MQTAWREHVQHVYELCSPEFWSIFELVSQQPATCADKVLKEVKKLLCSQPTVDVRLGHHWPTSTRSVRDRIRTKLGSFWDNVTHEIQVDLSQFNCGRVKEVKFSFVDPVFVWIQQCDRLIESGQKLVFDPQILHDPETGDEMYGAGIEYGLLLRAATDSIPEHARVALMNVSWDGGDTGYKSRSACPICVQVMNTNSGSNLGVGLVGYLPKIEVSNSIREGKAYAAASHYLLQVAHICLTKHTFVF